MSRCEARVVAAEGREVWVEVPGRAPICGSCATADACQTGLLGMEAGPRRYRLENRIGARVGVRVQLTVADGTVGGASLLSYVVSLLVAIGSGIAGMGAAWLLSRAHEVVLFEADERLGGHTHTHEVWHEDRPYCIDSGFIVHNRENYPLLTQM